MQVLLSKTLIASLVLVVAISSLSFGYFHDQSIKGIYSSLTPTLYNDKNQISTQNSTISHLQDSLANRDKQIADLQQTVASQNTQISQLQTNAANRDAQISQLQSASVDGWFTFTSSTCYYGCYVNGAISNYGTQDAKDIVGTLTWKNNGAFVQTNTINIGNLAGRSLQLYPLGSSNQYFSLNAPANQLSWSFTWT